MRYSVTVNAVGRPKGQPIEVPGVGVVPNGDSAEAELTEEQAAAFERSPNYEIKRAGEATRTVPASTTLDEESDG